MSTALEGTESAAGALGRVHYTHDAMIDFILKDPGISQGDLAKVFGYGEPWVSRIMNSDAFLARLAARKTELIDPGITASLDEKFRTLASTSLGIIQQKLETVKSPDLAFKALELSAKALGYGARQPTTTVQNNFVVALPGKAATASEWSQAHAPQPAMPMADVVDA